MSKREARENGKKTQTKRIKKKRSINEAKKRNKK